MPLKPRREVRQSDNRVAEKVPTGRSVAENPRHFNPETVAAFAANPNVEIRRNREIKGKLSAHQKKVKNYWVKDGSN